MALLASLAFAALLGAAGFLVLSIRRGGWPRWGPYDTTPEPMRLLLLLGVVGVPVVALAYFTSTSGFLWDDIKNFRQVQVTELSLHHLLEPTSGHFAPGHRLGDWVVQTLFPMNFAAVQVISLTLFAVSLVLFHRILAELFRPGPGPLLLTLLYGVSVTHVGVIQWWASSLDRMPATVGTFICMLAYIRFHRTRSWPLLAVSVGALAVALLFYVKPVFVPVYLVLLRVFVLEPEEAVGDSMRAALRDWWVWAVYLMPAVPFLFLYLSRYPVGSDTSTSLSVLLPYLSNLWFRVLVPNFFGFFLRKDHPSPWAIAAAVAAHVALVATVAYSVARWRRAWRAWAFFGVGLVVNAMVVGLARVGFFEPKRIAYTVYFNLEITFLFFIAVGAAFLGGRAVPPGHRPSPVLVGAGDTGPALTAAGLVVLLASSWWGASHLSSEEIWLGRRSRNYLDSVDAGLRRVEQSGRPVALVDGVVPYAVVPYLLPPYNAQSEVLPLLDEDVAFDATGRDLFYAPRDGTVRPVSFAPEAGGDVTSLLVAGALAVSPPNLDFGEGRLCVRSVGEEAVVAYTPPTGLTGGPLFLSLRYGSGAGPLLGLAAEPIGGGRPQRTRFVTLPRTDDRTTVFALDAVELQRVYLVLSPRATVCIKALEVGRLVPRA